MLEKITRSITGKLCLVYLSPYDILNSYIILFCGVTWNGSAPKNDRV